MFRSPDTDDSLTPKTLRPGDAQGDAPGGALGVAAAMMPHLPQTDDPVMPAAGSSFEDRVLLLLAAVALADGVLTYPEYELTASIVRKIFGERALNADLQARFHHALLNPPADPDALAASLAEEAVTEKVSAEQVDALLAGLEELYRSREQAGGMAGRLREAIDIAFTEERLARRRRLLDREGGLGLERGLSHGLGRGLEQSARLGIQVGKVAVGGTLQLMQNVMDMAQRVLPGRHGFADAARVDEPFTPPVAEFNARITVGVDALARAAWTLDEPDLRRELADFRRILVEQPFRMVLVGEGKRGKSSLVNALLADDLSPVRESVPETATVAEFLFSHHPGYAVRFLDEEHFGHLESYLAGEADNLLLRKKVETLRKTTGEERPRGIATLTSRSDIPDYLAADGRYSSLVARVTISLPLDILAAGMVLVDTPGLNATDSFQDYLAYEESLGADCLIFVVDARRPDSASELRLLRKLAAAGRAVSIIGVMTGVDRLNEGTSLESARERALAILQEACRGAAGLQVLGVVPLNAREAMQARCYPGKSRNHQKTLRDLDSLFDLLRLAMAADASKDVYQTKVAARCRQLVHMARESSQAAFERYRRSLPPAQFLELLERHADQLAAAAASHAEQARSVIVAAAHDVDEWRSAQLRALDAWEEKLVLRVMEAAYRQADMLGSNFAKESAWKEFDADEAPRIARQSIDEFLTEQQDILHSWNEKLRLFSQDINELSVLCLKAVEESADELGDICSTAGGMDHFLVQTNAHMRRLAVFLTGAGAGSLLAGGLINLMALGSAAFILLTNPLVLPGAALVGVAAYALQSVGNLEKRKASFLERKKKKTKQWAAEVRKLLEAELQTAREELAASYKAAVMRGFVPALEILVGEAVHLRLYLKVMDKIRDDTDRFEQGLEAEMVSLLDSAGGAHGDERIGPG